MQTFEGSGWLSDCSTFPTRKLPILIEKDHLGDWNPEKDCCLRLPFQQPVQKPSSESSDSLSQLKIQNLQ